MNRTRLSWQNELTLELRLHDWDGTQIGETLAEVRDHCEEAGQSPAEAFGDATAYAHCLIEQRPGHAAARPIGPMEAFGTLGGLIALILASRATSGLLSGGAVTFSLGDLLGLAVAVLAGVVLLLRPTPILRFLAKGGVLRMVLVGFVPLTVMVALFLAFTAQVLTLPWLAVAACSVLGLAVSVAGLWSLRGGDPVRDPTTGHTADPGRMLRVMTVFCFPILTALVVGQTYLLALI